MNPSWQEKGNNSQENHLSAQHCDSIYHLHLLTKQYLREKQASYPAVNQMNRQGNRQGTVHCLHCLFTDPFDQAF